MWKSVLFPERTKRSAEKNNREQDGPEPETVSGCYGKTTSSEIIIGRLVVTPAGVGDPARGIGPGEPPGPEGKPGTPCPPFSMIVPETAPWH